MKLLKTLVHIHVPLCFIPAVHLLPLLASVAHTVYLCLQPSQPELTAHSSQPSKDVVQTRCCLGYAGAADSVVVASGCWSTGDRPGVSRFCFASLSLQFQVKSFSAEPPVITGLHRCSRLSSDVQMHTKELSGESTKMRHGMRRAAPGFCPSVCLSLSRRSFMHSILC